MYGWFNVMSKLQPWESGVRYLSVRKQEASILHRKIFLECQCENKPK